MRTLKKLFLILTAAGLVVFTACNKEDLTNLTNQGEVKLTFKAITSGTLKSISAGTTEISEAWIGIEKIKFKPLTEKEEPKAEKIVFDGPFSADLVSGVTTPEIDWALIEPGLYKEVEFESENVLENDLSIVIRGTFTFDDLTQSPFEFSTADDDFDFEVENEAGILISEGAMTDVMVLIDLTLLFDGIDLSGAIADENGVLLFTDDVNEEITELLKEKLEEISKLKFEEEEEEEDDDDDDDENEEEESDNENND